MSLQNFEEIVQIASKDIEKGSAIVAKSFYRILRKNGFSEEQIVTIASEIIGCLTETLREYEERRSIEPHVRKEEKARV